MIVSTCLARVRAATGNVAKAGTCHVGFLAPARCGAERVYMLCSSSMYNTQALPDISEDTDAHDLSDILVTPYRERLAFLWLDQLLELAAKLRVLLLLCYPSSGEEHSADTCTIE
jgi:hypothetical protein